MSILSNTMGTFFVLLLGLFVLAACSRPVAGDEGRASTAAESNTDHLLLAENENRDWGEISDAQWRDWMTPLQYRVCRQGGTERPGTGTLLHDYDHQRDFHCSACGQVLFEVETKFESGTGWPSFFDTHVGGGVQIRADRSFGMLREEVLCQRCDSHLGHVFSDGPAPTGRRYCINSVCLFQPDDTDGALESNEPSSAEHNTKP